MPILPLVLAITAPASDGWETYLNPRFGFSICYPARSFSAGTPPENGDGLKFTARDGAILAVWGSNDALEHGLAGEQSFDEARLKGVSYRAKGKDWYVLSGTARGQVFYHKTFLRAGQFSAFELSYPATAAPQYRAIVTRMQRCFRPG